MDVTYFFQNVLRPPWCVAQSLACHLWLIATGFHQQVLNNYVSRLDMYYSNLGAGPLCE